MYFIKNGFILYEKDTFIKDLKDLIKLEEEYNNIIFSLKQCVSKFFYKKSSYIIYCYVDTDYLILIKFHIKNDDVYIKEKVKTPIITNTLSHVLNTKILFTSDLVIICFYDIFMDKLYTISYKTCCLENIKYNRENKYVSYNFLIQLESMSITDLKVKGTDNYVLYENKKLKLVNLNNFSFVKLYDNVYIFCVNKEKYIFWNIYYFTYYNNIVKFGIRRKQFVEYYECSQILFKTLLVNLKINNDITNNSDFTVICKYTYDVLPLIEV